MRHLACALAAILLVAAPKQGQQAGARIDVARLGPQTASTILNAPGGAAAPATVRRIETDHLDVTTFVSDEVVAPGTLFSVVFEVEPKRGIHLYAPGAKDYKVIGFRADANPLLSVRAPRYPASEIYHFKPLDERVPVFRKPFRLVYNMAFRATREARAALQKIESATITGTLEYQACDDRQCFVPRSIPVSYTVKVRQPDTERAAVPK